MHNENVMESDVFSHSNFFILSYLSWNFEKKLGFISQLARKAQLQVQSEWELSRKRSVLEILKDEYFTFDYQLWGNN